MKKVLIAVACLVAGAGMPARAQGAGPEVVTVKVREGRNHPLQLIISRSSGPAEVLTFDSKEMRKPGANEAATQQVLAKLYCEGFAVKNTFGGATTSATSTRSSSSAKSSAFTAPPHS